MAWIPIQDSGISFSFDNFGDDAVLTSESIVTVTGTGGNNSGWRLDVTSSAKFRITTLQFTSNETGVHISKFTWTEGDFQQLNTVPNPNPASFTPSPFEIDSTLNVTFVPGFAEHTYSYQFLIEVDSETINRTLTRTTPSYAYELDKGWSFDGNYIPHFVVLNWYFDDDPVTYKSIQKVRIHGLSKGRAKVQVSMNGMETARLWYLQEYTAPQYIDLPHTPVFVTSEFDAVSNYTDTAARGVSVQMKFEGRNTDIELPEPSHVIQVLIPQITPPTTGKRAN